MIVRDTPDSLELITQPAHAQLARGIMERCVPLAARARRDAILRAIGEHDNGWAEEDAAPSVDPEAGGVADFIHVPVAVRQRVWPRTIAQLDDDPWAAALVAHHAITVYDRFRTAADWAAFFAEMEAARSANRNASGLPLDDLAADYPFMRLGDLISLIFCTNATGEQRYGAWTIRLSGARVVVAPDPFGGVEIPIEIEARELRARRFRSDTELRAALRAARTKTLRGKVAG